MQDAVFENADDEIQVGPSNMHARRISSVFVKPDTRESPYMRVLRAYVQSGWHCACQEIWKIVLSWPYINRIVAKCCGFYGNIRQRPPMLEQLAAVSETRDFDKAIVRCLAWHPSEYFLAKVERCDVVYHCEIEPVGAQSRCPGNRVPMLLFNEEQDHVSCVAYRPVDTLELAVGCAKGVCLWNKIDTRSKSARRLMMPNGCYELLRSRSHRYITALQWNHNGQFLLTSSLGDCSMVVWEPDRFTKLHFVYIGASYTMLKWSPNEEWVFGARVDRWVSIWQTKLSGWERSILPMNGSVQTAAWSPCSKFLLLVLRDSTELLAICFDHQLSPWVKEAAKESFFVKKVGNFNENLDVWRAGPEKFGGIPHAITIDPLGNYLAVIYKHQPYVGLYLPSFEDPNTMRIMPLYTVCRLNEYPICICFESLRSPTATTSASMCANLTVAWSSGCVQLKSLKLNNQAEQFHLISTQSTPETQTRNPSNCEEVAQQSNHNRLGYANRPLATSTHKESCLSAFDDFTR